MKHVIKRDGRTVPFDDRRIYNAIRNAMEGVRHVDADLANRIACEIDRENPGNLTVESIQDIVERKLMASECKDVAKAYILYRDKRNKARNSVSDNVIADIVAAKKNEVTRENANMNAATPAGMMYKIGSERSKEYTQQYLLSDEVKEYIRRNLIHVHDLDHYALCDINCLQHPLDRVLKEGFVAGHGESRPAKRIETASIMACISLEAVQNEMFGGQSIPAFDFYMAPYVRRTYEEEVGKLEKLFGDLSAVKDSKVEEYEIKEIEASNKSLSYHDLKQYAINQTVYRVHQSMEALVHNLNQIHSRGGNQVTFSSINYGTDTSAEGRCVIRELLLTTERGVGNNRTAIFPIQVMLRKDGVNRKPGDPNYDLYKLGCRVSALRYYPNFLNLDTTYNYDPEWRADDPERYKHQVYTMGCRTRVYEDRFGPRTSIGRGNLSFTSINLPGLVLTVLNDGKSQEPADVYARFTKLLHDTIDVVGRQLYDRYKLQCQATIDQFPMLMSGHWEGSEILKSGDKVESVLKHGTLGVGFIGLAECLVALTGKHHGESEESQKLGISIIQGMHDHVKELADRYDLNYSLFATPAEGLSGKFTRKDKKLFPIIKGVNDKAYYTNSTHVPVGYKCSPSHKLKVEGVYHAMCTGGHIAYVEMDGDPTKNVEALMQCVDLACDNNIGYISVNHWSAECPECGTRSYKHQETVCPKCGATMDVLERITGYLVAGSSLKWNEGKLDELLDRVTHEDE